MTWETFAQVLILYAAGCGWCWFMAREPRPRRRAVPRRAVTVARKPARSATSAEVRAVLDRGRHLGDPKVACGRGICGLGAGHDGDHDF